MKQLKTVLILTLFLYSCRSDRHYNADVNDIQFVLGPAISMDFNSRILNIHSENLNYVDIARLSDKEVKTIIECFNENKIGDFSGRSHFINDTLVIEPPSRFIFKVLDQGQIKAEVSIASEYSNGKAPNKDARYRAANFRDTILKIMRNNLQYRHAIDTLKKANLKSLEKYKRS